jgi:putative redox protein
MEHMAVVSCDGGLRFTAGVRGHQVPTDQVERAGGGDSAVTPLELIPAGLGACVALYATQFCRARGISDEGLTVEVGWETERAPNRISRFDVSVLLPPGFPDDERPAMERAIRFCPVHATLAHPPAFSFTLEGMAVEAR